MQHKFPLFQTPIDLAHSFWKELIQPGDTACDATCGNGHDSLFLSSLPLKHLYLFDIQKEAIEKTSARLKEATTPHTLHHASHDTMEQYIKEELALIVYNLGYLPGSDKSIKTLPETTLQSIEAGMRLLKKGGVISITCYPGHPEGLLEEEMLLEWSRKLPTATWCVSSFKFLNRHASPSLLLLQRCL